MTYTLKEYENKLNAFLEYGNAKILECSSGHKPCKIQCVTCGEIFEFSQLSNVLHRAKTQKWICKKCGQRKINQSKYESYLTKHFPGEPYKIIYFEGNSGKCIIECGKCGHRKELAHADEIYKNNHICKKCFPSRYQETKSLQQRFAHFIENSNQWELLDTIEDKKSNDVIKCKCKKCGDISYKNFRGYLSGVGCAKCAGTKKITTEEFRMKIDDDYELLSEYTTNHTKVLLRHKECGFIFRMTPDAYLNQYQRCPRCKRQESIGEKLIREFLEKYKIDYIKEYPVTIQGRHLRFDFYLPVEDIYIEFNGRQHYEITRFSPTKEALEDAQYRDNLKKDFCGKKLLVISYKQIKQISEILQNQKWFNDYRVCE